MEQVDAVAAAEAAQLPLQLQLRILALIPDFRQRLGMARVCRAWRVPANSVTSLSVRQHHNTLFSAWQLPVLVPTPLHEQRQQQQQHQQAALAWLRKYGGTLQALHFHAGEQPLALPCAQLTSLRHLELRDASLTWEDESCSLGQLTHLTLLQLASCARVDYGAALGRMGRLVQLHVSLQEPPAWPAAGLLLPRPALGAAYSGLTSLTSMVLEGPGLADADLAGMHACSRLARLTLGAGESKGATGQVTQAGLADLPTSLTWLKIRAKHPGQCIWLQPGCAGAARLAQLTGLRSLSMSWQDEDLPHTLGPCLSGMARLTALLLSQAVDDAAGVLEAVADMPELQLLELDGLRLAEYEAMPAACGLSSRLSCLDLRSCVLPPGVWAELFADPLPQLRTAHLPLLALYPGPSWLPSIAVNALAAGARALCALTAHVSGGGSLQLGLMPATLTELRLSCSKAYEALPDVQLQQLAHLTRLKSLQLPFVSAASLPTLQALVDGPLAQLQSLVLQELLLPGRAAGAQPYGTWLTASARGGSLRQQLAALAARHAG